MQDIAVQPSFPSMNYLTINGTSSLVHSITTNSLTEEAMAQFELDQVELYTVQTRLRSNEHHLVDNKTYALMYFMPDIVNLYTPLTISTSAKLTQFEQDYTKMEIFAFEDGSYRQEVDQFTLRGDLGCTSAINLGFYLLQNIHSVRTRTLSIVTLVDMDWLQQEALLDREVEDSEIIEFYRTYGVEIIPLQETTTDCPYYKECMNQPGKRCKALKFKCR